jgi:cytochrome oxidase assembly protein ShyY1
VRALLTPRLLAAHLLALVCVASAGLLGYWQYDAWGERRAAERVDLTEREPVPLAEVMGPDDPFPGDRVGQPVRLSGTWLPDSTVYVSDREHAGADGFWVVTPLTSGAADAPALPVVRGWVAEVDAAPEPPSGAADVVGWLQPTEGAGEPDPDPTDDVLQRVRTADLVQHVDQDLYGAYAVIDPEAPATNPGTGGLDPADLEALPQVGRFTALRNLLYAFEWWVFGGFAAFMWWRYVRDVTAAREPEPAPDDDPVPSEP